ncbi:sensor histidine kinase [Sphingomonas sp. ID1715]|uniref:sensor histidine kinase n=1 Tax=Sphingomonas sp. ID1715 TaxID=1656898 RepID=UPI001489B214|nr:sensor histidine kinase [Sphingomonas sp. ID1715]NNM76103.1 sensor histidine kinase [Sphingomonas sp. ID1715]
MERGQRREQLRAAIALTIAFNLFTLLVFTLSGYFRGPESFRESLTIGLPMMIVDGFISFQLYFVLRGTAELQAVLRWSLVTVAVVIVALLQAVWDTELRVWADTLTSDYRQAFIRSTTINTYNSGMLAALLAFQAAYAALKANQQQLDLARQREREAQMLALRFQLNPHFLFNTLNAISSLVVSGRPRDADTMIDRLSSFLRGSLAADPDRLVTVEEEFEMLENYLEIESVRFGDRLAPSITLPDDLGDAQVPPFLLQPLVENAVKYAVAPSRTPVRVGIAARERGGRLELEVSDTGQGGTDASSGTGVGLANVRERLRLSFGSHSEMAVHDGQGFRVVLTMPLVRRPASSQQHSLAA